VPFTTQIVAMSKTLEADTFGAGGRTTDFKVATVQIAGATRRDHKLRAISGSMVDQLVNLDPVAASQPGSVLWLQANLPLDLRLNSPTAAPVCNALLLLLAASAAVSALYVTNPGTTEAVLRVEAVGGGSLQASVPLP
jgi:hypothetical protein